MRRRIWLIAGILLLLVILAWISLSVAYPVPGIRTGMTEQEVENVLGKPDTPTQVDGAGIYHAVPRWLLGRQDFYVITYDGDGRVAGYDLFESDFGGRICRTHR